MQLYLFIMKGNHIQQLQNVQSMWESNNYFVFSYIVFPFLYIVILMSYINVILYEFY